MRPPSERPGAVRLTVESIADSIQLLFDWLAPPNAPDDADDAELDRDDVIETEGEDA